MKTNSTLKIFRLSSLAALATAIAVLLVTQTAMTQAANVLVIEENSSTSLTVTYNGLSAAMAGISIFPSAPDQWTVLFPATMSFNVVTSSWSEPASPGFSNVVSFLPGTATVASDQSGLGVFLDELPGVPVGVDANNNGQIIPVFDDDAATAEATVPDSGSSFGLLFLALTALFGASRLRSLRLA